MKYKTFEDIVDGTPTKKVYKYSRKEWIKKYLGYDGIMPLWVKDMADNLLATTDNGGEKSKSFTPLKSTAKVRPKIEKIGNFEWLQDEKMFPKCGEGFYLKKEGAEIEYDDYDPFIILKLQDTIDAVNQIIDYINSTNYKFKKYDKKIFAYKNHQRIFW